MKQVNEKAIGVFIIASIVLIIASVMIFGSTSLFSQKKTFVLYFDDSVNGLDQGAPVKFKGVQIGQVKKIVLQVNTNDKTLSLPIVIEIDSTHLTEVGGGMRKDNKFIDYLINRGLRAQLKSQSLITGQLYIEMNFDKKAPAAYKKNVTKYKQIPTITSSAEAMTDALESAKETLRAVTKFINSKELKDAIVSFRGAMDAITNRVDSEEVSQMLKSADQAFQSAQEVLLSVDTKIDPVIRSAQEDLDKLKEALTSFTVLTDYLSRHPESLIQGKR